MTTQFTVSRLLFWTSLCGILSYFITMTPVGLTNFVNASPAPIQELLVRTPAPVLTIATLLTPILCFASVTMVVSAEFRVPPSLFVYFVGMSWSFALYLQSGEMESRFDQHIPFAVVVMLVGSVFALAEAIIWRYPVREAIDSAIAIGAALSVYLSTLLCCG